MFRLSFALTIFYLFLFTQLFLVNYLEDYLNLNSLKKYFFDINENKNIPDDVPKNDTEPYIP